MARGGGRRQAGGAGRVDSGRGSTTSGTGPGAWSVGQHSKDCAMSRRRFRLPPPPPPAPAQEAFVMVPLASVPGLTPEAAAWQQALYQWAFTEAQAVVQPSLP